MLARSCARKAKSKNDEVWIVQTEAFMRECGWEVVQLTEVAQAAPTVVPGFEYNCGPVHKGEGDYTYFLAVAVR